MCEMVIHFSSCPILLLVSCVKLPLYEQEVILNAVMARVGCYLRLTLLPIGLGLLEADLVGLVFVVVFPPLFHCPEGV